MNRGSFDKLITFETATVTTDDYGGETPTWGPIGGAADPTKEWANVHYGRGDERRQAAVEQGQQSATFEVLSNEVTRAVVVKNRIEHDGSTWDIVGIAPDTPRRGEIEFTAVRTL